MQEKIDNTRDIHEILPDIKFDPNWCLFLVLNHIPDTDIIHFCDF